MKGSFYSLLCCIILCFKMNAQVYDLQRLNNLYPNEPIVYTLKEESAEILNNKGELVVTKHVKEQYLILNDKGKSYRVKSIYTNSFVEIKNIKATNLVPKGNKYEKIVVDDIKVKDSNDDGTFYNDLKSIIVTYPNSSPGCLIDIEYDEIYNEPRFFGSFYITEGYPVLKSTFKVKCANTVNLNIKGFNVNDLKITSTEKITKADKTQTWSVDSVLPIVRESNAPSYRDLMAYYLISIKDYNKNDVSTPLVGSVDNLYKWYLQLVKNLNKTPSPYIQHITDSLVQNCKTDEEKLKKIYYWVQDKIAYIAYEDGLGGYIPRESDIICKRRFGDCKDMASILSSMGKAADLPIYLTWIGTRDIPYQFTEMPAPMAANHMIAAYVTKDTCFFLDATGKFQDLGTHTAFIQGKEAIIGKSESEYIVKKVPVLPSSTNYLKDSISIKIKNNNTVSGKGYLSVNGYFKITLQQKLTGKSYTEQYDYLSSFCEKGHNKFKLDTFIIEQNTRDKEFKVYYEFELKSYVTELQTELFFNMNFDKNYMSEYTVKDRVYPIEFNCTFDKQIIVNLEIDETQTVKFVPQNITFNKDSFKYTSEYVSAKNHIIFRSSINVNDHFIDKPQFETWNEFLNEINKNNNKSIALKKL